METATMIVCDYYMGDNYLCTFTQVILREQDVIHDNECEIVEMIVNNYPALALTYPDGRVIITWNDNSYRYNIETEDITLAELIVWAEKVS